MFALIACAALLAADAPPPATTPADAPGPEVRAEYEARRQATGRTPDDQVRLAYWCEAHGLPAERLRHLALAVLADPDHAAARALMGLVSRDRRWLPPEAVADRVNADLALAAALAEYDARRSATPYTADGQWGLANWADEHGLTEQARAHLTAVVRLDPRRDAAWKRLGYRKVDGRWATDAEVAAAKADAEAQKAADRKWRPLLERWRAQLDRPSQRAEAEANLLAVTDPRALPVVLKTFGEKGDGPRLVQLLGQVDSPAASRTLAALAVKHPAADVRRAATEILRGRDLREWAALPIGLIRDPIRYEVRRVNGPGQPGVLYVEGKKANVSRLYAPQSPYQPGDRLRWDAATNQLVVDRTSTTYGPKPNVTGHSLYIPLRTITGRVDADNLIPDMQLTQVQSMQPPVVLPNGSTIMPFDPLLIDPVSAQGQNRTLNLPDPKLIASNPAAWLHQAAGSRGPDAATKPRQVTLPAGAGIEAFDTRQTVTFSAAQLEQEDRRTRAQAQQQLDADVATVDRWNADLRATADRALAVLNPATGRDFGQDTEKWTAWLSDQMGYAQVASSTDAKPTIVEEVPIGYQPVANPIAMTSELTPYVRQSCFGAGTPVRTLAGPRPIEDLKVGDLVLTQSTATGALGYHPILVTHHNRPAPTSRIRLGDDAIVSSQFHRFWVARRGWVMARDLKAGDPIRTLGGVVPIDAVEPGKVEPVFNLDVADDADFFAGASAALVHDNTLPDPRLVPFDRPADQPKAVAAR